MKTILRRDFYVSGLDVVLFRNNQLGNIESEARKRACLAVKDEGFDDSHITLCKWTSNDGPVTSEEFDRYTKSQNKCITENAKKSRPLKWPLNKHPSLDTWLRSDRQARGKGRWLVRFER